MEEERKEILRMLSEGIIDVDGAERLLKALGERDERTAQRERHQRFERHVGAGAQAGGFASIAEAMSGIGPAVRDAVSGAMSDMPGSSDDPAGENLPELHSDDGSYEIPTGSSLIIRSAGRKRHGSVSVKGVEGRSLVVSCDGDARLYGAGDSYRLVWRQGDLEVGVPVSVASLDISISGGDISVEDVGADARIRTMGGDLELLGARAHFEARTMGGDLMIRLGPGWVSDSEAVTMGGDIRVELPEALKASIQASTMGGDIKADPGLGELRVLARIPGGKAVLDAGGVGGASLTVRTMGGDIHLRKARR